ncbi:hypothetical protein [Flavobacterium limi]|uniref:Lipoprotein n=1 Tax=Flavobacterium limi TaxID=2045105 RepID=A0ABQ1U899_9FLAO|nr:hypothetical protein [Flavobacterium limi]GGF10395.1 hypothetical protein GCM10011518_19490 [Flavobacterium limi]
MKNIFTSLVLLIFLSCQTTKIKNDTYKIATSSPELGSIGQSRKNTKQENSFAVRTLPKLENKIRITIGIVPFNRKLNKVYKSKARYNQNQTKVAYIDSLPKKPELVTIKILDINGLVSELNAAHNEDVFRLLRDTENSKIITSIAVSLSVDEITKIRQSDAYYLINSQEKKYTIALYKSGKKTDVIDINTESIVGYQTSRFCWATNQKRQWYIADIVEGSTSCNGNTQSSLEDKKSKSLFDM